MAARNSIAAISVLQPRFFGLVVACLLSLLAGSSSDAQAKNLLRNGNFAVGMGDKPASWAPDLWSRNVGTEFSWEQPEEGLGVAVIRSDEPNDARWTQTARVKARSWYHLSGWVRGRNVSATGLGANLSTMRGFDSWLGYYHWGEGYFHHDIVLGAAKGGTAPVSTIVRRMMFW